jgi:hypothetical protein
MRKSIITLLSVLASVQVSMANLAIGDIPVAKKTTYVVNPYGNGNQTAKVDNMPLDAYLKSIYSGYTVRFEQMDSLSITIKESVLNNPVAIMTYLSKAYGVAFNIDQKNKTITVEPSDNVTYESYKHGLYQLTKERLDLVDQKEFVTTQKLLKEANEK